MNRYLPCHTACSKLYKCVIVPIALKPPKNYKSSPEVY